MVKDPWFGALPVEAFGLNTPSPTRSPDGLSSLSSKSKAPDRGPIVNVLKVTEPTSVKSTVLIRAEPSSNGTDRKFAPSKLLIAYPPISSSALPKSIVLLPSNKVEDPERGFMFSPPWSV